MGNSKKYFLGLDIGTDSVGYAVTSEQYDLLKHRGEPMWGVHIFEEAALNSERRAYRTARRRLDRRQQRVKMVQEIFAPAIADVDINFYRRIKESALWREDAHDAHCLFCDDGYTDKEYHEQYPTIHHLISELIHNGEPHDVRLVYLACAWLVAHRGHFFSDVSKENIEDVLSIEVCYNALMEMFTAAPWNCSAVDFGNILKKKSGVNAKYKELCQLLFNAPKAPKGKTLDEDNFISAEHILKLLCGGSVKAKDIFGKPDYDEVPSFSLNKGDDELEQIFSELGDDAELIRRLKAVFDWALLADILSGNDYISDSKVDTYEQHKLDLKLLKNIIRKYAPEKYREMFRDKQNSVYAKYKNSGKQEDFCKFTKGILGKIKPKALDKLNYEYLLSRAEAGCLCPKQMTSDNRVIPYQVYWVELKKILDNASEYLPFLNEADAEGYTAKAKLLSVMEFRVPYFVGPLNRQSSFSWFERKAEGKILPWNFEDKVDLEKSEQAFIDKMTNSCTYLPGADVLPKCSLLHEKFQVLNEINTITVNGQRIPAEVKQRIYTDLFCCNKKVTVKAIKDYLLRNGFYSKSDLDTFGGIDETIKSSLASHFAFRKLLSSNQLTEADAEEIIKRSTYTEDRVRFAEWVAKTYPNLCEEDRKYVSKLKFKDFARLSKELLCSIYGTETKSETGEAFSIIERMWRENLNLMEILSDRYTYGKTVQEKQENYYREYPKRIDERMEEMRLSNSVKRSIIRTLDIVSDVVKATGSAPEKIFIEMARGGTPEGKGKRTKSRYDQLKELYSKCELEDARLMEASLDAMGEDRDNRLLGEKLFLYYLQLGKSIYSGKPIDLEQLSGKAYEVDHIYPQSKVKDDSVLNNKVLVLSQENGDKGDKYPIAEEIRSKMYAWWKLLLDNNFITAEKFKRLTRRTPFDENEEWNFINRQLVETRQSTKAAAALLKEKYPDTEIVYVKAGMVAEFRQEFDMLKCRSVNDLHHAKDAYLNIVVGNVYSERFTRRWFSENRSTYNLKISTLFSHPVTVSGRQVWGGGESLGKVKHIVQNKNAVHFTRYAFCRKGGLFDQQPKAFPEGVVSRKNGMPVEKYGGYWRPAASFFVMVKYKVKGKTDCMLIPVELMHADAFAHDEKFAYGYAAQMAEKIVGKQIEFEGFPLGLRPIKVNTLLELDGMRACISGKSSGGSVIILSLNMPLVLSYEWEKYIKHLERFNEKKKENPKLVYNEAFDKISPEKNIELYDLLAEKLTKPPYANRPANPAATLKSGRSEFVKADIFAQTGCLMQLLAVFGRISGGCDLRLVGGGSSAAATSCSVFLKNWKKNFTDVRIIDVSASGLYETRSENLLKLL